LTDVGFEVPSIELTTGKEAVCQSHDRRRADDVALVVVALLYVTGMDTAFAVAGAVRMEAYGGRPVVASTILVTPRLAFPSQLIEIKLIART